MSPTTGSRATGVSLLPPPPPWACSGLPGPHRDWGPRHPLPATVQRVDGTPWPGSRAGSAAAQRRPPRCVTAHGRNGTRPPPPTGRGSVNCEPHVFLLDDLIRRVVDRSRTPVLVHRVFRMNRGCREGSGRGAPALARAWCCTVQRRGAQGESRKGQTLPSPAHSPGARPTAEARPWSTEGQSPRGLIVP